MTRSHTDDRHQKVPDRYSAIHQGFGWKVPKRFNMAQACCGQWAAQAATARRVAIREHVAGQGLGRRWTFGQLQSAANRLSQALRMLVSGRAEGTGLGLSLALQIAREHQGSLSFRSRPGHTVFTLLLPVPDAGEDNA